MKRVSRRELAKTVTRRLSEGMDPSRAAKELAAYLIEQKMLNQAHLVVADIAAALMEETGHVSSEVVSAFAIDAASRQKLETFVAQATGAKTVEVTVTEDKSLIGGVIIKIPGHEYDASVRRKLNLFAQGEA